MLALSDSFGLKAFHPITPYERDSRDWERPPWTDKAFGRGTGGSRTQNWKEPREGSALPMACTG